MRVARYSRYCNTKITNSHANLFSAIYLRRQRGVDYALPMSYSTIEKVCRQRGNEHGVDACVVHVTFEYE